MYSFLHTLDQSMNPLLAILYGALHVRLRLVVNLLRRFSSGKFEVKKQLLWLCDVRSNHQRMVNVLSSLVSREVIKQRQKVGTRQYHDIMRKEVSWPKCSSAYVHEVLLSCTWRQRQQAGPLTSAPVGEHQHQDADRSRCLTLSGIPTLYTIVLKKLLHML